MGACGRVVGVTGMWARHSLCATAVVSQTASGKTFTMQGTDAHPGILRLSIDEIFATIAAVSAAPCSDVLRRHASSATQRLVTGGARSIPPVAHHTDRTCAFLQGLSTSLCCTSWWQSTDRTYTISCSFVEIYNEIVRDLLADGSPSISIREHRIRGPYAQCMEVCINTPGEMMELLRKGETSRVVGETDMNKRSSRSHTIFTIVVKSAPRTPEGAGALSAAAAAGVDGSDDIDSQILVGKLNLVDLAGSESVRVTNAVGDRLKEAGKINTSLLALARVIEALGSGTSSHISFRDSKLTRILQPSLIGNTRTSVICCVSPAQQVACVGMSVVRGNVPGCAATMQGSR